MSTATVDAGSPATKFIVDMFSASTVNPVYLSSLANKDAPNSEPRERHVTTRSSADIDAFVRRWDRKHRGLYFCVSTIQAGVTRRAKETASELTGLHADIDFKSVTVTQDEIKQKLRELTLLPSKIVDSGNGLHCYWHFREALPATSENIALVETLLRQLAEHLGGDPAVCEIARLMRLPGTHNTKEGAWNEVRVVSEIPARYDPGELAEWLDELNRPAIARKPEASKGNGQDTNPWLQVAARYNFKPPIDVEQRLAAMQFQGADSAAIHPTQLAVSASLLTHGTPLEEVVEMLLAATRAAAGPAGARWNWQREERDIRDMCKTWLTKHPELGQPDAKTQDRATPAIEQAATERATETDTETGAETANEHISEQVGPSTGEQQTNAGAAAAPATGTAGKKTRKRKLGRTTLVLAIADGVIKAVRQAGNDLLLTGGELHVYGEGIWMVANAAWEQRLRVLLQEGAEALGEGGDVKLLSAAWRRLLEHPGLYFERVNWDPVGKIAVANGVLDLRSKEFTSWSPQYFLRRKRLVAYDPVAKAPQVDEFLARLFQDRDAKTAAALIGLLQEFAGAALCVQLLHREQRRALFPVGPSRTGKSKAIGSIRNASRQSSPARRSTSNGKTVPPSASSSLSRWCSQPIPCPPRATLATPSSTARWSWISRRYSTSRPPSMYGGAWAYPPAQNGWPTSCSTAKAPASSIGRSPVLPGCLSAARSIFPKSSMPQFSASRTRATQSPSSPAPCWNRLQTPRSIALTCCAPSTAGSGKRPATTASYTAHAGSYRSYAALARGRCCAK